MKKVFAIAMIATAMVACNNSGKKEGGDKDTTKAPDTTVVTPPAPDTAAKTTPDTAAKAAPDTTKK